MVHYARVDGALSRKVGVAMWYVLTIRLQLK